MRGLIVDYFGVLDGTEEDRASWRSILAGARANDVRMAVPSNEPEGPGAGRVREGGRAYAIEHVILGGGTGSEKPEAESFLEAARRLELEPRECVMVDVAIENVLGAVRTGMIGVFYQVFDRAAVEIRGLFDLDEAV